MSHFATPPTVEEIAERLSVVQRWNGNTIIPWSVLQHSLLTAALVPEDASTYLRLAALLHDASESLVGDTPRPYKTPEQREFEKGIQTEIFQALGVNLPAQPDVAAVRKADDWAALAEAEVLIPVRDRIKVWHRMMDESTELTDEILAGAEMVWNMRDMDRLKVVQVWLASVYTLLDAYFTEGED